MALPPKKNDKSPLILDIKGNSLDDGPGIRSVIFFKGCPLSCVWCHNPESIKTTPEISFDQTLCIDCGLCREACPEDALSKTNRFYIDRNKCTLCFLCEEVCPPGALKRVGTKMTIDEILKEILPDKPFFDTSGGGVTLSGGEPTLFADFTADLLKTLKAKGIHTLLETCGHFKLSPFMDKIYPYTDTIYFDIKIFDSTLHKKYCGLPNDLILDNFISLIKECRKDSKELMPRTPLIPVITDTEENISKIAEFLVQNEVTKASLLEYNPLWQDKYHKLGSEPYTENSSMKTFSDREIFEKSRGLFEKAGLKVI